MKHGDIFVLLTSPLDSENYEDTETFLVFFTGPECMTWNQSYQYKQVPIFQAMKTEQKIRNLQHYVNEKQNCQKFYTYDQ